DEAGALPVSDGERAIAASGEGEALRDVHVEGTHLRLLTVGLGAGGAVQVARPLNETDAVLHRVLWILVALGAGGVALAAVLGEGVARSALAPIRRFTDRTETIAATPGDPTQRIDVERDDELGRLAASFNTPLDPARRDRRGPAAQRHADRARPRAGVRAGRPPACLRALLPIRPRASDAGLGPRPGDRPPGRGGARRQRRGAERPGRRRGRAR